MLQRIARDQNRKQKEQADEAKVDDVDEAARLRVSVSVFVVLVVVYVFFFAKGAIKYFCICLCIACSLSPFHSVYACALMFVFLHSVQTHVNWS